MPSQQRISKPAPKEQKTEEAVEPKVEDRSAEDEELDALLDEIDSLLESNAAEFIAGYVQKGGE